MLETPCLQIRSSLASELSLIGLENRATFHQDKTDPYKRDSFGTTFQSGTAAMSQNDTNFQPRRQICTFCLAQVKKPASKKSHCSNFDRKFFDPRTEAKFSSKLDSSFPILNHDFPQWIFQWLNPIWPLILELYVSTSLTFQWPQLLRHFLPSGLLIL